MKILTHFSEITHTDGRTDNPVGAFTALVPSGASVGAYEAHESRDGDKQVYNGNSVLKAVHNVEQIIGPELIRQKFNVSDLEKIDQFIIKLDGTKVKEKLGANAILGVSMACARAGAAAKVRQPGIHPRDRYSKHTGVQGVPLYQYLRDIAEISGPYILPIPFFNVLNGGRHSGNAMAFQEFMIAPIAASSMMEAVQWGCEVYQALKEVLVQKLQKCGSPGRLSIGGI